MAAKYSAAERKKNTAFSFIFIFLTIYSYLIGRGHNLNVINMKECLSFVLSIFGLLSLLLEISNIFFFHVTFFGFWLFLHALCLSFSFFFICDLFIIYGRRQSRVVPCHSLHSADVILPFSFTFHILSDSFLFLFSFVHIFVISPPFLSVYVRLSMYFFSFYKHKYVGNSVIVCCCGDECAPWVRRSKRPPWVYTASVISTKTSGARRCCCCWCLSCRMNQPETFLSHPSGIDAIVSFAVADIFIIVSSLFSFLFDVVF